MKRPIAILAIAPIVLALAACGSSYSGGSTSSSAGASTASKTAAASTTSAVLMVAGKAKVGRVLVDAQGRTLYRYTPDKTSKSTCTGACAKFWPPATIQGSGHLTADGVKGAISTTTRADGTKQLVFDGKPLYRFAEDASKADAKGQGVQNIWFVIPAKSSGAAASKPSTTTTPKSGYGY
jgi:predicted lipoprotein with Yx(FWY)xxD motif